MKSPLLLLFFTSSFLINLNAQENQNLTDYVNPLMGTDSEFSFSNGNTYPAISLPWGNHFWAPQTREAGDGWFYRYDDLKINGIKQTHQPSPWLNDYGAFAFMTNVGKAVFLEKDRQSWFSHKAESAKPHHYSVYLADYHTTLEMSPTQRGGHFVAHFPKTDSAQVIIDGFPGGSMVKVLVDQQAVIGYAANNHGGVADGFKNWFVIQFNQGFISHKLWTDSLLATGISFEGERAGAILRFMTDPKNPVEWKTASSFISLEQAWENLAQELTDMQSFQQTKEQAKARWEKELGRVKIEDPNINAIRTFYSCYYRTLLFPRPLDEITKDGKMVHYSPYDGQVHDGYLYTDNGFWDTFRSVFPFFNFMYPSENAQIMAGLVNTYKESGWLPEWASPGHRSVMVGSNSASLIADAYLKDVRGYDIEILYEAMIKNTKGHGPVKSVGRYGAEYYNDLGYVPYNVGINENAARSLEYAYADYCIWRLGQALNKPEKELELYKNRALNYVKLFDPATKLMRGKNEDGSFQSPFNPFKWGDAFTEGNSWHYTWSVFQDIEGLIDLMGGKTDFVAKLDSVFSMPPIYDDSYYGFPIHEIVEMQVMNFGQYAHGNQPVQHMIYLYNYAGRPDKAQYWLRQVMDRLYSPTPDGYAGDEDNGQTSAWYVWSAMGMYPVTPGSDEYVLGSPLFKKMTLTLENGKKLILEAPKNDTEHVYVHSIKRNGKAHNASFFNFFDLMKGGKITFDMAKEAPKNPESHYKGWSVPYSMSGGE